MHARSFARRAVVFSLVASLATIVLAGPASADGTVSIDLQPVGGLPSAGAEHGFVARLLEGDDHPVEGARVLLIAGIGGEHDEHSLHGGSSSTDNAPPFEVDAVPGAVPGEYLFTVTFPKDGMWTAWVVAEKDGAVIAEASWVVSVAPVESAEGAGSPTVSVPAVAGGTVPDSAMAGSGDGGLTAVGSAATDDHGAEDGHVAADGRVNWWVIGGFLTLVGGAWAHATWLKRRLRATMASGELAQAGVRS